MVLKKMIFFVKPLKIQMITAIICGAIGHMMAISIPVIGMLCILTSLGFLSFQLPVLFLLLVVNSILRGVFAYLEQQRNHYIAFTILAIIRDKVFTALRKLCPAKLDGKNRGNLISLITSDIELMEVFYAHTISPIAIASIVSILIAIVLAVIHPIYGVISLVAHISVGVVLPLFMSKNQEKKFLDFRNKSGELSSYYLESLRGIEEILQLQNGHKRLEGIKEKTRSIQEETKKLSLKEGKVNAIADALVLLFGGTMLIVSSLITTDLTVVLFVSVLMMSSFGPVISLSKLSVGLGKTIACAKRVQELIEEEPEVIEQINHIKPNFEKIDIEHLSFSYEQEQILKDLTFTIENKNITSIIGKSGSGKSTIIKLIMRFWNSNGITISGEAIENIDTQYLRSLQSYMTQESDIFKSTIGENIKIGKIDAKDEEMIAAAKKASIDEFIMSLPNGYDTLVGELGDTLSGGERQRIGLARAFLHGAPLLLLDEPTSNLDSLNESIILTSIQQEKKATILVSHRKSTLGISDVSYEMKNGEIQKIGIKGA